MPSAVANTSFPVALVSDDGKTLQPYHVSKGDSLTLLSDFLTGISISGGITSSCVMIMGGYLVQIEEQSVFVNQSLLEISP